MSRLCEFDTEWLNNFDLIWRKCRNMQGTLNGKMRNHVVSVEGVIKPLVDRRRKAGRERRSLVFEDLKRGVKGPSMCGEAEREEGTGTCLSSEIGTLSAEVKFLID